MSNYIRCNGFCIVAKQQPSFCLVYVARSEQNSTCTLLRRVKLYSYYVKQDGTAPLPVDEFHLLVFFKYFSYFDIYFLFNYALFLHHNITSHHILFSYANKIFLNLRLIFQ